MKKAYTIILTFIISICMLLYITPVSFADQSTAYTSLDPIVFTYAPVTGDVVSIDVNPPVDNTYLNGDIINIYADSGKLTLLKSYTVTDDITNDITFSGEAWVTSLGQVGSFWITYTTPGYDESNVFEVPYLGPKKSDAIAGNAITILISSGTLTGISITGYTSGSVNVYNDSLNPVSLVSSTITTNPQGIDFQAAISNPVSGHLYVTYTSSDPGATESDQVSKQYNLKSNAFNPGDITITNNRASDDEISVTNTSVGDVINVYADNNKITLITTATATGISADIFVAQLGALAGTVYVTRTSTNLLESDVLAVLYNAEPPPVVPKSDAITGTITPQYTLGQLSSVVVTDTFTAGDIVRVYKSNGTTLAATSAAAGIGATSITANITTPYANATPGTPENIYVTRTSTGDSESDQTQATFDVKSTALADDDITIVNNCGISSKITVINLSPGDVIKVYEQDGTTLIGSVTVAAGKTSTTFGARTLKMGTPGDISTVVGHLYVSVIRKNQTESNKTQKDYYSVGKTDSIGSQTTSDNGYLFFNEAGGATLILNGLVAKDIITVYGDDGAHRKGTKITSGIVATGKTIICITFDKQTSGNHIFVTRRCVSLAYAESDALDILV